MAKRTQTILVHFDLPENLVAVSGEIPVYLCINDPKKNAVTTGSSKSVLLGEAGETITPVKTATLDQAKNPQPVDLSVTLTDKLKSKGIYTVSVYTDKGLIGSAQVRMN